MSARRFPIAPNSQPTQLTYAPGRFSVAVCSVKGQSEKRFGKSRSVTGRLPNYRSGRLRTEGNTLHATIFMIINVVSDFCRELTNLSSY
jgi:hypothetical protein